MAVLVVEVDVVDAVRPAVVAGEDAELGVATTISSRCPGTTSASMRVGKDIRASRGDRAGLITRCAAPGGVRSGSQGAQSPP